MIREDSYSETLAAKNVMKMASLLSWKTSLTITRIWSVTSLWIVQLTPIKTLEPAEDRLVGELGP